jgi:hypothetical protein
MKFKAYNHIGKRWLEPHEYLIDCNGMAVNVDPLGDVEILFGVEVVQFTGKKDKNGNDIYQGDIFKNYNGYVFEFDAEVTEGDTPCDYGEVIGNKFEHPKLLKTATK